MLSSDNDSSNLSAAVFGIPVWPYQRPRLAATMPEVGDEAARVHRALSCKRKAYPRRRSMCRPLFAACDGRRCLPSIAHRGMPRQAMYPDGL